jgi:alpha-mannosidase
VDDGFVLSNDTVRVMIDQRGLVTSLVDLATGRDAVPEGQPGNLLQLFRDTPAQYDAWDIDENYRRVGNDLTDATLVTLVVDDEHRASVRVVRRFGASSVSQVLTLDGDSSALDIVTTVDWHEQQKLLKLAFPLDVHADRAASEIQFGHVWRPTHANTSWDAARYETCAHRWVYIAEPGFGVVVANDSTYGHDITRSTRPDGGTTTLVRQSLLRAPLFPDPTADQGEHVLRTSIRIGDDVLDAVREGYRVNLPLRVMEGAVAVAPVVSSDCTAIVVEAVKLAEDRSGDLVVRLYEARGAQATGTITFGCAVVRIVETDLLERTIDKPTALLDWTGAQAKLHLHPFQIVTLRISPGTESPSNPTADRSAPVSKAVDSGRSLDCEEIMGEL